MDHFALPTDDLYKAWQSGKLHRNFMGYTTQQTGMLLGLGVSSISDTGTAFAQNKKTIHDYYEAVDHGQLAVQKGYFLNAQDASFKKYILDISCKGETFFREEDLPVLREHSFPKLEEFERDGLVEWDHTSAKLTSQGHYFIRNICSAFDLYLGNVSLAKQIFSKAI
jgi:oxygen-independent coproporphyrinogen III oxidase